MKREAFVFLLLAHAASAQVAKATVDIVSTSALRVTSGSQTKTWPTARKLPNPFQLGADTSGSTASFATDWSIETGIVRIRVGDTSRSRGYECSTGVHSLRITVKFPKTIDATLVVSGSGFGQNGNYYTGTATVGSRKLSFSHSGNPQRHLLPVKIGPTGLQIHVQSTSYCSGSIVNPQAALGAVAFEVLPAKTPRIRIEPFGTGCGANTLPVVTTSRALDPDVFFLTHLGIQRNAAGALVVGLDSIQARLPNADPNARCFLHTTPVLFLPFRTDASGRASFTIPVPAGIQGSANLQTITSETVGGAFHMVGAKAQKVTYTR